MKLQIDTEKIIHLIKNNLRYLPATLITLTIIVFALLTFFAINPREDSGHVLEGEARVRSLDIRFNTKLLGELSATKNPTQLGTAGGRDPFSGF